MAMAYVPPLLPPPPPPPPFPTECIRIAMLNADTATPNTYAHMGTFGDILHNVLAAAASRAASTSAAAHVTLRHAVFDVVRGEYPSSPSDFDAFLITASAASALARDGGGGPHTTGRPPSWIQRLEDYIVVLHERHPRIRLFGSCFGHHVICQALLGARGTAPGPLRVERHPRGWEIGVSEVHFTDEFREAFDRYEEGRPHGGIDPPIRPPKQTPRYPGVRGRLPSPEAEAEECIDTMGHRPARVERERVPRSARLQFVHEDQVVFDTNDLASERTTRLPPPWTVLGSTEHCAIQGVYHPGRVLTLQGHFEFDKFENRETRRMFGAEDEHRCPGTASQELDTNRRSHAARPMLEEDDGEMVAAMVLRFLVGNQTTTTIKEEEEEEEIRGARQLDTMDSGMLTPRSSLEI